MSQRTERRKIIRRQIEALFASVPDDRRRAFNRRGQNPVDVLPGATRPAVDEQAPAVERRRVPGATE